MIYEHKAVIVDSQIMKCTPEYQVQLTKDDKFTKEQQFTNNNWGVSSIEKCCDHWSSLGWEHYQTTEVAGNDIWCPKNVAKHGFLLMFRRQRPEKPSMPNIENGVQ